MFVLACHSEHVLVPPKCGRGISPRTYSDLLWTYVRGHIGGGRCWEILQDLLKGVKHIFSHTEGGKTKAALEPD